MISSKETITLNKIVVHRKIPFVDFLVKDLFNSDPIIAGSAIRSLDKLSVTGLGSQIQNLFKNSPKEMKVLILEYMRNNPCEDYNTLILDFYRGEDDPDLLEKVLLAMGTIGAGNGDIEDILKKRASLEERSEIIRNQSILAVVGSQNYKYLKDNIAGWLQGSTDPKFSKNLVVALAGCKDPSIFLELHKLSKNYSKADDPISQAIAGTLFEIYSEDAASQPLMNQLQDKIYQFCRSQNLEEVSMATTVIGGLDPARYRSFISRACSALLMGDSSKEDILKQKQVVLTKVLPVVLEDDAARKSLSSIIEKLLLRFQQILEETKKNREGSVGSNPKKEFVEFFETLRNAHLLNTVITYLKSSPPDEARRNLILSVLKKLSPSLNGRPKQLLASVVKLLMTEDGRLRSQLAVECGKINLEESLDSVFKGIVFLVDFCGPVLGNRILKALKPLQELCWFFPNGRKASLSILKSLLASNQPECCSFLFSKVFELKEKEIIEMAGSALSVDLDHLQPMKAWFGPNSKIPAGIIQFTLQLLEACPRVDDLEWIRILYEFEAGGFGVLNPSDLRRVRLLQARCGLTSELEQFSKVLAGKNYKLSPLDMEVLLANLDDFKTLDPDSIHAIKDICYGCLSEVNQQFATELGFILHVFGEEQGQKMVIEALKSGQDKVVSTAIKLLKKTSDKVLWAEILQTLKSDSVLVHQLVFGFFTDDSIELNNERVRAEIIFLKTGERPEVRLSEEEELERLADDEKKDLKNLFQQMRSTRMDNKAKFEMEQNMKELTIFFIDIAGYTKRSNTSDISEIMVMLDDFGKIIQPIGESFKGTLIKKIGDCFMYTFSSPLDAVLASIEIQKQLAKFNEMRVESERLHTRIGLNTGKVFVKDGDVYGDPVNTASRVESKAPMDGLLINETTFEGVRDFIDYEKMEPIHVKGIDKPLQTYVVKSPKPGVLAMYKSENSTEQNATDGI